MSKISLTNLVNLENETTAVNAINANNAALTTALDNTLSRDGTSPNTMSAPLDMNSQAIVNLPAPVAGTSPLRYSDLTTFVGGGTVTNIPSGGTTGQVLAKSSNANYAVAWTSESAELTAGTNIVLTGTTPTTIATSTTPTFTTVNGATVPTVADTLVGLNTTDVLTNKTLTTPTINNPTVSTGTFTSPTMVTPTLGAATATTVNKVTITAPASGSTLTIPNGVTLTGPAASGTAMTLGNNETVTGVKTFGAAGNVGQLVVAGTTSGSTIVNASATASGTLTLPAATDTLMGKATTDILTNKTFDSAGTGNSFSISGVATSRGQYPGETTTGSATAGNIGEFISSVVLVGSAVSLTTGTDANITSISLTAGDWDVWGTVWTNPGGTTTSTFHKAWITTTSATAPTVPATGTANANLWTNTTAGGANAIPVGPARISISGTTTVFLGATVTFAVSTMGGYGILRARRVR